MDRWAEDEDTPTKQHGRGSGRVSRMGMAGFVRAEGVETPAPSAASAQPYSAAEVQGLPSASGLQASASLGTVAPPAGPPRLSQVPNLSSPTPSLPPYQPPAWAVPPPQGAVLQVSKEGVIIEEYPLIEVATVFGRLPASTIVLDHASISRQHAAICFVPSDSVASRALTGCGCRDGLCCMVIDLGSAHGTWVDGQRLFKGAPTRLKPGSVVQLGASTRRFVLKHEAPKQGRKRPCEEGALEEAGHKQNGKRLKRVTFPDQLHPDQPSGENKSAAAAALEQVIGYTDGSDFRPQVGPKPAAEAEQGVFASVVQTVLVAKDAQAAAGKGSSRVCAPPNGPPFPCCSQQQGQQQQAEEDAQQPQQQGSSEESREGDQQMRNARPEDRAAAARAMERQEGQALRQQRLQQGVGPSAPAGGQVVAQDEEEEQELNEEGVSEEGVVEVADLGRDSSMHDLSQDCSASAPAAGELGGRPQAGACCGPGQGVLGCNPSQAAGGPVSQVSGAPAAHDPLHTDPAAAAAAAVAVAAVPLPEPSEAQLREVASCSNPVPIGTLGFLPATAAVAAGQQPVSGGRGAASPKAVGVAGGVKARPSSCPPGGPVRGVRAGLQLFAQQVKARTVSGQLPSPTGGQAMMEVSGGLYGDLPRPKGGVPPRTGSEELGPSSSSGDELGKGL